MRNTRRIGIFCSGKMHRRIHRMFLFFSFSFILMPLPFMDSDFFSFFSKVESGDRGVAADLQHNTRDTFVGVHGSVYFHFILVHATLNCFFVR